MRLVGISDTHGREGAMDRLPPGDVLVHTGDITFGGNPEDVEPFLKWFDSRPFQHKVLVAGNHDSILGANPELTRLLMRDYPSVTYLQDSGCVIDGVRFWGSPWVPRKQGVSCKGKFFMLERGTALADKWAAIPHGTDVVLTHSAPYSVLDGVPEHGKTTRIGCPFLLERIMEVRPRAALFGHVHSGHGVEEICGITFANCSICDPAYEPSNAPLVVEV